MERVILQFRQTLAGSRPWVVVAVIVAAALSIYIAGQGWRYFQAAGNNSSVRGKIADAERATGPELDGNTEQEARLGAAKLRLDNLRQMFDYPDTDDLMKIVSDVAGYVGLDLVSMTVEEARVVPRGSLQYRVRPISVVLDGPPANVLEFLAILYTRVPVVVASDATMLNLDTNPSTQLQLRFYLSPEPLTEEGADTAG